MYTPFEVLRVEGEDCGFFDMRLLRVEESLVCIVTCYTESKDKLKVFEVKEEEMRVEEVKGCVGCRGLMNL